MALVTSVPLHGIASSSSITNNWAGLSRVPRQSMPTPPSALEVMVNPCPDLNKIACQIGSVRCIIIPIDGDRALGFRCIEFTSCSMADGQFASLICSQLNIGLAHREGLRRQEENVTYYRYYMTIKLFSK